MNILQKNYWKAFGGLFLFFTSSSLTAMPIILLIASLQAQDFAILYTAIPFYIILNLVLIIVVALLSTTVISISAMAEYELPAITQKSIAGFKKCNPYYVYIKLLLKLFQAKSKCLA